MGKDGAMTAWRVGRATITPIIEVESVTSPRFLFKDLDKTGVLDIARRSPWLQGRSSTTGDTSSNGSSASSSTSTACGSQSTRASATTSRERTPAGTSCTCRSSPTSRRPAFPLTRSTSSCARTCTSTTWAGTRRSSTAGGCRRSPTRATCSHSREFEYWQATTFPDGDDVLRRLGRALGRSGRRRPCFRRPCRRRGDPVRLDTRPHSGSRVGRRRVRGRACRHHRRHDPHAVADRRGRPLVRLRLRSAGGGRHPRSFLERYSIDTLVIGTHWGGPGAGRIVAEGNGWAVDPVAAA